MLVRNKDNRNISVAIGHGYTVEKVAKAMEFLNHSGRNTKLEEWVEMYNYLKGENDTVHKGCRPCAAAKYTAAVRNYARFGYLTLINEGHKPEEFEIGEKKTVQEPIENEQNRIVLEPKVEEPKEDVVIENGTSDSEVIEDVKEALEEEPVQEEATEEPKVEEVEQPQEETKPKRGRKSSK